MVEVKKKSNETTGSLLRRFSKSVQRSGVLRTARAGRFHQTEPTKRQKRLSALHRKKMAKHYEKLKKLGRL